MFELNLLQNSYLVFLKSLKQIFLHFLYEDLVVLVASVFIFFASIY